MLTSATVISPRALKDPGITRPRMMPAKMWRATQRVRYRSNVPRPAPARWGRT
jgi:hypothetical protein